MDQSPPELRGRNGERRASLDITKVREIGQRFLLMSITGFSLGTGTIFQDDGRLCSAKLFHSCNWASKDACVRLHHTTPYSPAAIIGLSLFRADKTAGSDRVSGDKSSLCDGRNSSLWKDSIGCRNPELIWLAISWSDRRAEPRSISWQTKGLSQEREPCQRST